MAHAMGWITVLSYAVLIAFPGNRSQKAQDQMENSILVLFPVFGLLSFGRLRAVLIPGP